MFGLLLALRSNAFRRMFWREDVRKDRDWEDEENGEEVKGEKGEKGEKGVKAEDVFVSMRVPL